MIGLAKLKRDAQFCNQSLSLLNKIGSSKTPYGEREAEKAPKPSRPEAEKISQVFPLQSRDHSAYSL